MSARHRGPIVVGVVVAALFVGPAWAGHGAGSSQDAVSAGWVGSSLVASKKKPSRGTLAIKVSGSGSYTVTGKGFRKTSTASKSFKVKPGAYTIKAPTGLVKPGKAKVRKGRTTKVNVTFAPRSVPAPATTPPATPAPNPTVPQAPPPVPSPPPVSVGATRIVSTDEVGNEGNGASYGHSWSPDGTKVAFVSYGTNLVGADTNGAGDVFVKTLATGAVQRISTDASGDQANGTYMGSWDPVWSPDGLQIAFRSEASNLTPGDTNNIDDLFVKTLSTGAIQRISTDASGAQANGSSGDPQWSPDGSRIAFYSYATNLVVADTNGISDVFVKTLSTGAIQRVSTDASGAQANGDLYGYWGSGSARWSPDGSRIAFLSSSDSLVSGDTNKSYDVFVKTLSTGAIQRVSTDTSGAQAVGGSGSPTWSPDGTKIAFTSDSSNLVAGDTNGLSDAFVKTLDTGAIQRISTDSSDAQADGPSETPTWSPDGSRIALVSEATNLVANDSNQVSDIFVKTLSTGLVQRMSTDSNGLQATGDSYSVDWSPDGTSIAFASSASNLVPSDLNGVQDVFVKAMR